MNIKGARTIIHEIIDNPEPHKVFNKNVMNIMAISFIKAMCNNPLKESTQI